MNSQNECPICMEVIEFNKNCVTTECGHSFHTSCLMANIAHNGFSCPCCRNAMAEELDEEDSDDEEEEFEDDEDEEEDDVLRGFRFFINNVNGEEHDPDDIQEEIENEEYIRETAQQRAEIIRPPVDLITQKLIEQGVTMEQLINSRLKEHEEYEENEEESIRVDGEIYGKIRVIITNYQREQEQEQEQEEEQVQEEEQEQEQEQEQEKEKETRTRTRQPVPEEPSIDFDAQPKTIQSSFRRVHHDTY